MRCGTGTDTEGSTGSGDQTMPLINRTFIKEHAMVFRAALDSTMESCAASASNLFGAVTKGCPVSSAMSAAISSS